MADHCPLGRCATPEDVARVVGFLSSEDGGWVNGQVITISGKICVQPPSHGTKANGLFRRLFPVDRSTRELTMCLWSITYDFWATAKETLHGADYRPLRSLRHSLRWMRWSGWEVDTRHIENYEMTHESDYTAMVFSSLVNAWMYVRGPLGCHSTQPPPAYFIDHQSVQTVPAMTKIDRRHSTVNKDAILIDIGALDNIVSHLWVVCLNTVFLSPKDVPLALSDSRPASRALGRSEAGDLPSASL